MTELTPKGTPTGTSRETAPGTPAGTSTGAPGRAVSRTPADTAPGTRARPLSEKAATGGTGQDRYPAPAAPGTQAPAVTEEDRTRATDATERPATERPATGGHEGDWLMPRDECDRLAEQMRHAVAGFVDGPGAAVEEADRVLEEAAARFAEAVTERRRSLRRAWQSVGENHGEGRNGRSGTPNADTEVLRLALRDYRELTDRLISR